MTTTRASKTLQILKGNFTTPQWATSKKTPFQTLIITIISQNTTSKNTVRAFEVLSKKFKITPEALAKTDLREIEDALQVAGLFRNKAKTIKRISQIILDKFNGSLDFVFSMPFEETRKTLSTFPGVGPKTADVVLLFSAGKATIPVDTHVHRVSKRLGLVSPEADYEGVRMALQGLYSAQDYLAVHLVLIMLGRKYCKAPKPICRQCPIDSLCPSKRTED